MKQRFRLLRGNAPAETRLEKRLRAVGRDQLRDWADTYLNEAGRALLAYNQHGDSRLLDEAHDAAVTLVGIVQEIKRRE